LAHDRQTDGHRMTAKTSLCRASRGYKQNLQLVYNEHDLSKIMLNNDSQEKIETVATVVGFNVIKAV